MFERFLALDNMNPKDSINLTLIYAPNTNVDLHWEPLDLNDNSIVESTSIWLAIILLTQEAHIDLILL